MISCTEFIPSYSEIFTYVEEKYGRAEVDHFWAYLFAPTGKGIPLVNFVEKEGIRGCYSYWSGTLNEEAADFTLYLNEKAGWFMSVMHRCPSKGRLLELQKEIGITPYHDYCLHCDSYRAAVEKVGLKYIYNFNGVDHASCSMFIYDPAIFDGRIIIDDNTVIMDRRASDNEYFHRDFHSILNMCIDYIGENYGREVLHDVLARYTRNVYRPVYEAVKKDGLQAIAAKIQDTYRKEKAEDVLELSLTDDCLQVKIDHCPAVEHLHHTDRVVSPWYRYTTEDVMQTLAADNGYVFSMEFYDDNTGAARYSFRR